MATSMPRRPSRGAGASSAMSGSGGSAYDHMPAAEQKHAHAQLLSALESEYSRTSTHGNSNRGQGAGVRAVGDARLAQGRQELLEEGLLERPRGPAISGGGALSSGTVMRHDTTGGHDGGSTEANKRTRGRQTSPKHQRGKQRQSPGTQGVNGLTGMDFADWLRDEAAAHRSSARDGASSSATDRAGPQTAPARPGYAAADRQQQLRQGLGSNEGVGAGAGVVTPLLPPDLGPHTSPAYL